MTEHDARAAIRSLRFTVERNDRNLPVHLSEENRSGRAQHRARRRPRSIRLHTAQRIAHQQRIHAAAAFLGNTSLDRTAAALRWHPDHDTPDTRQPRG